MKFLIITLLLTTVLNNTQAKLSCPAWMPTPFQEVFTQNRGILPNPWYGFRGKNGVKYELSCKDVAQLGRIIKNINTKLLTKIDRPNSLILNMMTSSSNAYFASHILNLPKELIIRGQKKHPVYTQVVWAHEYGHAIFHANLSKYIPVWKQINQLRKKQLDHIMHHFVQTLESEKIFLALAQAQKKNDMEKIKKLNIKIEEISKVITKINEKINQSRSDLAKYQKLIKFSKSYNEFFADLVAVLYKHQGDAISDALFRQRFWSESPEEGRQYVINRDFTNRQNRLDRWKVSKKYHNMLAPVRYFIWAYYIEQGTYRSRPAAVLKKVLLSIKDEIEKNIPHIDAITYDDNQIKKMNSELIATIKSHFTP